VGYVSRGRGISVHKDVCPNMRHIEKERIMSAVWANVESDVYTAALNIEARPSNTMLSDISGCFAKLGMEITSLNAKQSK
jgi:GTP pyrophosphokinase